MSDNVILNVCCCLWDANQNSEPFSRCYSEAWVEKLHAAYRRNLTKDFRFVCFTDRERRFSRGIEQELLDVDTPDYGAMTVPYRLNEPMILTGLDTVIVANIDHMADYCLRADRIALPRDPYEPSRSINGVALVPAGHRMVHDTWRGENDMAWLRTFETVFIDDLFPGQILSLKAHDVRRKGLQDARIIYMHGRPKQPELLHLDWMREHWRC